MRRDVVTIGFLPISMDLSMYYLTSHSRLDIPSLINPDSYMLAAYARVARLPAPIISSIDAHVRSEGIRQQQLLVPIVVVILGSCH